MIRWELNPLTCNWIRNNDLRPKVDETVVFGVLGLAPCHCSEKAQVRMADQAMYHQGNQSVFVGGRLWNLLPPPARRKEKRKKASFYIYSDVTHTRTHTHPAGTGSTLKGKRKKKRTQRTGQGQNSAGGRGTNGPPEPTYTARRT